MTTRRQIGLSLTLIVVAATVAAVQLRGKDDQVQDAGAEGHNHAAMGGGGGEARPVRLDAEGRRLIGVTYATVERKVLAPTVRTVGMVTYDETRLATVNPKIDGWVEHLYVDFTGAPVRKGEPLMDVYSPKLVSAQEELILARRLADASGAAAGGTRADVNAMGLLESARRRLAYWDIPEDEIRRIEETGEVQKTLTLRAPASGIVVEKNVVEGDRIMPGMTVFRIADLSTVWIDADIFEKDLDLVRERQTATVRFEAYPGREFTGRVTYVYPTVSVETRTGSIRLELPNPDLDLKPGMYADIEILVPSGEPTLVVPRSAVLATGERAVVFVQEADGTLVPRNVTPGRAVGREVEILAGVAEGERVVSSAGFLIDAESNLGSAMGEDQGDTGSGEHDMSGMDDRGGEWSGEMTDMPSGGSSGSGMDGSDGGAASDHDGHGN